MSRPGVDRRVIFACLLGILLLALIEGLSYVAIAVLGTDPRFDFTPVHARQAEMQAGIREILAAGDDALLRLDDELGWVYGPEYRGELYSSNALGLRGRREYPPEPPPDGLRIAAFGDSFVHGNEVADDECWSARLEALDPRIEALNYGVGGYGTDQALLYYERRGLELDPDVVLLGFVEVDYARNVNRFRRFLSVHELPLFKPRFVPTAPHGGALALVPNPFPGADAMRVLLDDPDAAVRRAAPHDWFYQPLVWSNPLYDRVASVRLVTTLASDVWRSRLRPDGLYRDGVFNVDSEPFRVLVAVVERFAALAAERDQPFALVVFPSRDEDVWGDGPRAYQPLLDAIAGRHRVLDLAEALRADAAVTPANLRRASRHYGPEANDAVARAVRALALAEGWLGPQH